MKFCLILFLAVAVAQGQSFLAISPAETSGQRTNTTLPVMNNSIQWAGTNRSFVYLLPKQSSMAAWKLLNTESQTNRAVSAFGATNVFHSIIATAETNSTTNVIERAIYNRVGLEADKLVATNKVASIENNLSKNSTK